MVPYLFLLGVPFLFSFVGIKKNENGGRILQIGSNNKIEENSLMISVFFIFLYFMLALRGIEVGNDTLVYKHIFITDLSGSLSVLLSDWKECIFRILNYVIGNVTDNFQIYLAVVALIEVIPIAYIYNRDKRNSYIKIIVFLNLSTFIMLFSGIRQSMAISIGLLAFDCVRKNKKLLFVMVAAVASLVHTSGFMVFLFYPVYHIKLKVKHLLFIIPTFITVYVFKSQIFLALSAFVSTVYEDYSAKVSATGAIGTLLLFAVFTAITFFFSDEKKMDSDAFGLRNILVMATILQCFAPLHTLAMRINYYFIILIPLALGKCFSNPKEQYRSVAKTVEIALCLFFTVYFIYNLYSASQNPAELLHTVPYKTFLSE